MRWINATSAIGEFAPVAMRKMSGRRVKGRIHEVNLKNGPGGNVKTRINVNK